MTAGEYTMVVLPNSEPFPAPVVLIGGGGDGWDGQGGRSGGAGGRTSATATFKQGNTYKVIVGSSGPICTYSVRWTWTEPGACWWIHWYFLQ